MTHGHVVEFYGGRVGLNEHWHRVGFTVRPGIQEELVCAMVAQGCAEIVPPLSFAREGVAEFPGAGKGA